MRNVCIEREGMAFIGIPNVPDKDLALAEILVDFILHGMTYEPETTKLVKEHVKSGDTCVDVGASIGYFTILFGRQVGVRGKVYSIEPTENQVKILAGNVKVNQFEDRVEVHHVGAYSYSGEATLKVNNGVPRRQKVVRLDDILPEKVDFIKIDTDGAEPEVLKGLEQTIIRNPQLKMVIEYYPRYVEKLGLNPKDMLDFLDKYFEYSKIEGDYGDGYWNFFCTRKLEINS